MTNGNADPRRGTRGGAFLWVILAVVALAAVGVWLWERRGTAEGQQTTVTWTAKKEKLRISVVEAGQLKAAKSTDIYCEVKGGATILYLVDEGTQVQKDEVLVRLDASNLENDLTAQRIKYEQANAAMIQAEKALEIQQSTNQSNLDKAGVDLDLAKTDLSKYEKGDWPLKVQQSESDIMLAEGDKKNAEQTFNDTRDLVDLEFAPKSDEDRDKLSLDRAKVKWDMAKMSLDVMKTYEYKRQMQLLNSTVSQNDAELGRVKLRGEADIAQKTADLHSKQATFDLEKSKLEDLEEQLAKTTIKAPTAGLVVYPVNQGGMRGNSDRNMVEEGATAREHQLLISLPDTSEMTVVVSVHESAIDKVRVGQPVEVGIDALGDKGFLGKVTFIAPLPDSQNQWLNPDLKVYRCEITLGGDTSQLRPGMSASAEIVVDEIPDAIAVPIHAVKRRGDHYYCYIQNADGKPEIREVQIGLHNDEHVAITEGLAVGDKVYLATPPGAPQPTFPDSEATTKASVDELREKAAAITSRARADDRSRTGDNRQGRGPGGFPQMSQEERDKWAKMTPEERQKAMEDRIKNMTPEEKARMEEMRKRFSGGGNGGFGNGSGGGGGGRGSRRGGDRRGGDGGGDGSAPAPKAEAPAGTEAPAKPDGAPAKTEASGSGK